MILGPIWIVLGLVPSNPPPLGFEKWLRLIFANLAAFPLVAFILVFARVIVESVQADPTLPVQPTSVFIPPLVGNPNANAFGVLFALGAILISPTIPGMIRERMKVGQGKFGATIAAGLGVATGVAAAPATKMWKNLNRRNSTTGAPEGALAVWRHRAVGKVPGVDKLRQRRADNRTAYNNEASGSGPTTGGLVRKLRSYDATAGQARQDMYGSARKKTQQAMKNKDHGDAIDENRRRGGS